MKNIAEYLPYYIGQQATVKFRLGTLIRSPKVEETTINAHHLEAISCYEYIKPHLRKLKDMTEEERKELFDLFMNKIPKGLSIYLFEKSETWAAIQTHYLIKQGFDLFGLIDEGLAIDKATVKK